MLKRLTAILLLTAIAGAALFSCSGGDGNAAKDTAVNTTAAETEAALTPEESRQAVPDNLPDRMDFKGADFRTMCQTGAVADFWVEDLTGEVVDDAIYQRNSDVSERFNVNIPQPINDVYTNISNKLKNSVNAGENICELYLGQAVQSGNDALNGLLMNWYDVEYMDFSAPWYPPYAIENLTLNGRMFTSVSDLTLSPMSNTYCMFFDKVMAENYGLPDIYGLVNENKWVIDRLIELTKDIYVDENGNGEADADDYYGFASDCKSNSITYLWAFDQPIFKVNPDYTIELTYNSEKTVRIIEKVKQLYYGGKGALITEVHNEAAVFFSKGRALFANGFIGASLSNLRDLENDFGIIPYPMWDEAQDDYYTMSDGRFSIIAVPVTVTDTEMVGAVTHAMGAYGWKNVVPAYYDVALKVKGARDEESVELIDRILDGRYIDFPYLYDAWKGYAFTFEQFTYKNSNLEFASMYESKLSAATKHYENVINLFLE